MPESVCDGNGFALYNMNSEFTSSISKTFADIQAQTIMSSRIAGEKAKPAALSKASASVRESLSASAS